MLTKYLYGFFVLDRWCEVYLLQVNSKYVSKVAAAVLTSQRTSLSLFLFMFLFFTPAQWSFLCLTDSCFPGSFKLSQKLFSEKPEESHAAYFSLGGVYMRKLAPARVSYRHDFLISYRVYMMTGLFHI